MGHPVPGLNVRLGDGREWTLSGGINRSESSLQLQTNLPTDFLRMDATVTEVLKR
jgi:hypothetical protein